MVTKTPDARRDIDQITDYIALDSVDAALRWYDRLDGFFSRIDHAPGMGTARDSFGKGLRSVAFDNHLIFFRKQRGGVEIVRVIHGARKWQRILKMLDG